METLTKTGVWQNAPPISRERDGPVPAPPVPRNRAIPLRKFAWLRRLQKMTSSRERLPRGSRVINFSIEVSASSAPLMGVQLDVAEGIANCHRSRPVTELPFTRPLFVVQFTWPRTSEKGHFAKDAC